jgi:hypothetical protein
MAMRSLPDVLPGRRGIPGPPGPPGPAGPGGSGSSAGAPNWDPFSSRISRPNVPGPRGLKGDTGDSGADGDPGPPNWDPFSSRISRPGVPGPRGLRGPPGEDGGSSSRPSPIGWSPFKDRYGCPCWSIVPRRDPQTLYLWGMSANSASGTSLSFGKHAVYTNSNAVLPIIGGSTDYYGSGVLDPWLIMDRWRLIDVKVVCAGAAVSQATVGASPVLQLEFYQANEASNTLLYTVDLPCISGMASIGISNTTSGRTSLIYFAKHQFSPRIEPTPFTFFGWKFRNQNSTNNKINAVEYVSSALIFERRGK